MDGRDNADNDGCFPNGSTTGSHRKRCANGCKQSVCSPIASGAHVLCYDTQPKAFAAAGVAMANTHAGAIDALALDIIARCISLKQWCHDEHFVLTTLFHNLP
jgi:hypothetical protein